MTFERKRAIIIISATLVVGIIIGVLATGMLARHHYRGDRNRSGKEFRGRQGFATKIYGITKADSAQINKMKSVIRQTMTQIDSLQKQTDSKVKVAIDSMITHLQPFLSAEQLKSLYEFSRNMSGHSEHLKKHR